MLCGSPPRVPNGPRGKGRRGGPLTSENPRHGRSRLCGARAGARTDVCGRVAEPCRPRRGPGAQACEAKVAAPPGVGGIFFFTRFFRGSSEGSAVGGFFSREEAGRRLLAPAQVEALSRSCTLGKWGHSVPRNSGPGWASLSPAALAPSRPTLLSHGRNACPNAKTGNCFSGTFTATASVPYPG